MARRKKDKGGKDKAAEKEAEAREGAVDTEIDVEALRAESEDYRERWQRAAADYQNLRRRGLADAEERTRRAMQPFLEKMLMVLDYLDMALACPTTTDESKNLAIGVRLTRDQFLQALEQEEVRVVPPSETFDPSTQEAKDTVERDDVPAGSVVGTIRAGYTWRGEILRYAQVIVAKAPGEASSDAAEAAVSEATAGAEGAPGEGAASEAGEE